MDKKVRHTRDYLHLYLGHEAHFIGYTQEWDGYINAFTLMGVNDDEYTVKPILRPLSDMTEEEDQIEFPKNNRGEFIDMHWHPEGFVWLLSKGFDLFGLIEEGLAIDATTLKLAKDGES